MVDSHRNFADVMLSKLMFSAGQQSQARSPGLNHWRLSVLSRRSRNRQLAPFE